MAKGNLFLGQAKGKVGSVVFSRAFGQQITRTKPTSVKNPKTIGQNTQRAILATIAKSAAAMTSLVDHSFTNVAYGAESVRHFRKINMGILRDQYLNTQNGANLTAKGGNFVPNPLKISEGSLPSFFTIVNTGDVAFKMNAASTLPSGAVTVENFLKVYPSLQGGDQITLVKLVKSNDGELIDGDALVTMSLDRIVFAPNAFDDKDALIMDADDGVLESSFLDLTKTTNPRCLSRNTEGGLGFSSDGKVYYAALILSRKVNNQWQRSTQYLDQVEFGDHTDNESAIASYGATASVNDATEYLNQADESTSVSGVSGAYMNVTIYEGGEADDVKTIDAGETDTTFVQGASGAMVSIKAQAFAPKGKRIITVEVDRPDGSYAAHGAKSVNYDIAITAATAGNWAVTALFDDGSRAVYVVNLAVKA